MSVDKEAMKQLVIDRDCGIKSSQEISKALLQLKAYSQHQTNGRGAAPRAQVQNCLRGFTRRAVAREISDIQRRVHG